MLKIRTCVIVRVLILFWESHVVYICSRLHLLPHILNICTVKHVYICNRVVVKYNLECL